MEKFDSLINELNLNKSLFEEILKNPDYKEIMESLVDCFSEKENTYRQIIKSYETYKHSPFLKGAADMLEFKATLNRKFVVENEFNKRIDETLGTMYYFKEKTKEFSHIAGIDPDEMRMAFSEGIQNVLEHGQGERVELYLAVKNIASENVYMEMSFKHYLDSKEFYSLKKANKSADEGILNLDSPRGRGEFMMREIMDERKFINGLEKTEDGSRYYFFKRVMRKYKNSKPKEKTERLTEEFKKYIDSLQDYRTALFIRMDYFKNKKELVLLENKSRLESIKKIMQKYGYTFNGSDVYKQINFTFWENDLLPTDSDDVFNEIVVELQKIIDEAKEI
ncbi:MAG: ATP-binding protein [bacterium]|nr:ATP-binding protein [bacterium]